MMLFVACAEIPPPENIAPAYADGEDERLRQAMADLEAGNYEAAWFRLWDLSLEGHPAAQVNLAQLYREGHGIPVDPRLARRWIELAATSGHPLAQYRLGELYEQSGDGRLDLQVAALWYERAARQGFAPARAAAARLRQQLR
jgi:hypothetical protein